MRPHSFSSRQGTRGWPVRREGRKSSLNGDLLSQHEVSQNIHLPQLQGLNFRLQNTKDRKQTWIRFGDNNFTSWSSPPRQAHTVRRYSIHTCTTILTETWCTRAAEFNVLTPCLYRGIVIQIHTIVVVWCSTAWKRNLNLAGKRL